MEDKSFIYYKNNTKDSENVVDITDYFIKPSKHFVSTWMKKWGYDIYSLRNALENAYKIYKVGKIKYEAYIGTKHSSRKIIFTMNKDINQIFIITGAEGK